MLCIVNASVSVNVNMSVNVIVNASVSVNASMSANMSVDVSVDVNVSANMSVNVNVNASVNASVSVNVSVIGLEFIVFQSVGVVVVGLVALSRGLLQKNLVKLSLLVTTSFNTNLSLFQLREETVYIAGQTTDEITVYNKKSVGQGHRLMVRGVLALQKIL